MLMTSSFVNLFRIAPLSWPRTPHAKPTHNTKPMNLTIHILDTNFISISVKTRDKE
jgi:hypothetical protein